MSIWSLGTERQENGFLFKLKVDTFTLETLLETYLVCVHLWSSHVEVGLIKERMVHVCQGEEIFSEKKGQYMCKNTCYIKCWRNAALRLWRDGGKLLSYASNVRMERGKCHWRLMM